MKLNIQRILEILGRQEAAATDVNPDWRRVLVGVPAGATCA
jgi:hypothetical protein